MMKKITWYILAVVLIVLGALSWRTDIPSTVISSNSFAQVAAFIDTPVNRTIAVVSTVVCFLYVLCSFIGRK
jgi:hypothetical protein